MPTTACPLCQSESADILWRNALCRVLWVEDDDYPGYCRVILNSHRQEMTDLPESERQELMAVVFAAEAALRETARPDKVNLASLGNQVPHLHWHVIPRWQEDATFPDTIWVAAKRSGRVQVDRGRLKRDFAARLRELLSPPEKA
ncbi:MAG: HIT family protein [Methylohalobius crimeensis]